MARLISWRRTMMLQVPTFLYTPATHALSQPLTSLERIFVPTALSPTVVAAEFKARRASSEPDLTLPVVVFGFSPLKIHCSCGCSHATRFQRTSPMATLNLPAGALRCLNSTPTMDVMLRAISLTRLWYVLILFPEVSLHLS